MNNPEHYQSQAEYKASSICRECESKIFPRTEDNTQGFDLGSRLRGPEDISISPACDEFPEGCEQDKCSREITITAGELHDLLVLAKKTHLNFKDQDFKLIDLEILIDKIEKKLWGV